MKLIAKRGMVGGVKAMSKLQASQEHATGESQVDEDEKGKPKVAVKKKARKKRVEEADDVPDSAIAVVAIRDDGGFDDDAGDFSDDEEMPNEEPEVAHEEKPE